MTDISTTSLLERAIYTYADVDRLNSLTPGTGWRWLEGYERDGVFYEPVLRDEPSGTDLVTWGEMMEARLLAQFRDRRVSLQRLRPAVVRLRDEFGRYPLARVGPFLEVEGRELVLRVQAEIGLERALQPAEHTGRQNRRACGGLPRGRVDGVTRELYDLEPSQVEEALRFELTTVALAG